MKASDRDSIYNCIVSSCDTLCKSANLLCELIDSIEDRDSISKRISAFEDEADNIFHDARFYFGTNKLFEEKDAARFFTIMESVECVIDAVDELARDFCRYNITEMKENAISLIINIERASDEVMQLVVALNKSTNRSVYFKDVLELDNYKVEATKLYDINMNKLYSTETNPIEIMKWQAIYASILNVYEAFEDVAEASGKYIYSWE